MVLFAAGIVVLAAFLSVLLIWLCGRGAIPRNRWVGIRLSDVLASDAAWREGHSTAVGPASVGAVGAALVHVVADLVPAVSSIIVPFVVLIVAGAGLAWATATAVHVARITPARTLLLANVGDDEARPLASARITHSGGLIPATVVSWAPATIVAAYRLTQPVLPQQIASHWNFIGQIDSWVPTIPAFWVCLGTSIASALVVTAFVMLVGDDLGQFSGSISLGALVSLSGMFTLTWITSVTTYTNPDTSVFLLWPLALLIGALVFVLATIRRPPALSAATAGEH